MLVENTEPRARSISNLVLIPGNNKVDDLRWDELAKSRTWEKPIKGLVSSGVLVLTDSRKKITVAMVEKTNDLSLIEAWLDDPANKGPVRGALKKKLEALTTSDVGDL